MSEPIPRGSLIAGLHYYKWRLSKSSPFSREWWLPLTELAPEHRALLEAEGCGEKWRILGNYNYRLYPHSVSRTLAEDLRTPMFGRPWHPKA
jgi:hypothetical protein